MIPILLFLLSLYLFAKTPDGCITCHRNTTPIDAYHPYKEFGCASCHGGDKNTRSKELAHRGIVLHPAHIQHAKIFCAKCHKSIIDRIQHSIMYDMHGVYDVLRYQFKETSTIRPSHGVYAKMDESNLTLAQSHFRKMCAACHIDQNESIFPKGYAPRGGGCVDCHRISQAKWQGSKLLHPRLSTRIPSSNCLKCHNRSDRIGLAYFGKFESEGYGTPYHHGQLSHKIEKNRYYYPLPADIHHTKAKLDCIDCHTERGVMGDGKYHEHMEGAEDISCIDCHAPRLHDAMHYPLAAKLAAINAKIPLPTGKIAITHKKGTPLYNVQLRSGKVTLFRKRDGKAFFITPSSRRPYHTLAIHKRLACTACHSSWTPSCYGCHEVYLDSGRQLDWISKKRTPGQWQELRSFLRWEHPTLGIGYNKKIMPFAPGCQVIATIFHGRKVQKRFVSMAMAGWDPHTTQKKARSCQDCHFDPASLGLGRGILHIEKGRIAFAPFYDSRASGMPFSYPIDAFETPEGHQLQSTSRTYARSFNAKELTKILQAYTCILCHTGYNDPIYRDFTRSKKLFLRGMTPCLKK